jgi:hypothetical protein
MSIIRRAIEEALGSDAVIPRERVVAWAHEAQDPQTLALLYRLTGKAYERIVPELGKEETCRLIRRYLLECIRLDPQDELAFDRYEAARTLEAWFDHLADAEGAWDVLSESAADVTTLFLAGTEEVRTAIETGFLEHVLEQTRLRPLFSDWQRDDRLRAAWENALAWGEAHPRFTKSLRERGASARPEE